MIDEQPRDPATSRSPLKQEMTMLKTISAALLAVSVLAAPALAAGSGKTTQAPAAKTAQVKPNVMNPNAKMGPHQVKHAKTHQLSKATTKHIAPASKRG
ncbi:His-rich protein BRANT [Bradyrhizobium sp. URHD0069]|uniref:His-rich protein BRANT n=1 Tax=Bradyrhizobium sp. URHD0069 TaxID=1380355 RepID=UPI001FD96A9B|nr:hypothetical protein [Bradyrhizobium sp. URHD0069]